MFDLFPWTRLEFVKKEYEKYISTNTTINTKSGTMYCLVLLCALRAYKHKLSPQFFNEIETKLESELICCMWQVEDNEWLEPLVYFYEYCPPNVQCFIQDHSESIHTRLTHLSDTILLKSKDIKIYTPSEQWFQRIYYDPSFTCFDIDPKAKANDYTIQYILTPMKTIPNRLFLYFEHHVPSKPNKQFVKDVFDSFYNVCMFGNEMQKAKLNAHSVYILPFLKDMDLEYELGILAYRIFFGFEKKTAHFIRTFQRVKHQLKNVRIMTSLYLVLKKLENPNPDDSLFFTNKFDEYLKDEKEEVKDPQTLLHIFLCMCMIHN
jgi:hypothetical protein